MTTTLIIRGMRTVHCVRAAFTALAAVEGISTADVSLGRAVVEHDGRATVPRLREALQVVGFDIERAEEQRTLPVVPVA